MSAVRSMAHALGWHTNACRGDLKCWAPVMRVARNGWWRNDRTPQTHVERLDSYTAEQHPQNIAEARARMAARETGRCNFDHCSTPEGDDE